MDTKHTCFLHLSVAIPDLPVCFAGGSPSTKVEEEPVSEEVTNTREQQSATLGHGCRHTHPAQALPAVHQELDRQVQEALSCPCVDDIKSGPCGTSFVNAFSCYMKCQARQQVSLMPSNSHQKSHALALGSLPEHGR